MIKQHICLKMGWCVDIFYDVKPKDTSFILDMLADLGCPMRDLVKAEDLLLSGIPNEGLTYSNKQEHRTIIVVGHATSIGEWLSTISHEVNHLADHIAQYYGMPYGGEEHAYLTGDIAKAIYDNAVKHIGVVLKSII